jgi:hypothetical protein
MTATAEEQAAAKVAAVRDDPARRLELAARFYDRRIERVSIRSYRRAEMAFMRWQIRRGVLAAPGADRPGSPWWRAVNEDLLRDAWQAQLLDTGQPGTASRPSVAYWVRFLRRPSAEAWGWPVYAWPYDQRHVWTTTRAPRAIRTLARLTTNTDTDQLEKAHRGQDDG